VEPRRQGAPVVEKTDVMPQTIDAAIASQTQLMLFRLARALKGFSGAASEALLGKHPSFGLCWTHAKLSCSEPLGLVERV